MDFSERLEKAIRRGQHARDEQDRAAQKKTLSEEDARNRHSAARLNLSDYVEDCLRKLCEHFPGFRFETIVNEKGWGAKINRDDLKLGGGRRENQYSRLEVLVSPFDTETKIVAVKAKGTVHNKELVNRSHFQYIAEFDEDGFRESIDLWILEFAEKYAARI